MLSRMAYQLKSSGRIHCNEPQIDFADWTRSRCHLYIQPHDSAERFESLGVEVIFGSGEFVDQHTLKSMADTLKPEPL